MFQLCDFSMCSYISDVFFLPDVTLYTGIIIHVIRYRSIVYWVYIMKVCTVMDNTVKDE